MTDSAMGYGKRGQGQAAIVDLSIPQTKQAQRLTPYTGPVPSYVAELERESEKCGLSARRMWNSRSVYEKDTLQLFFAGTKKQVSEFSIFTYPENITWPSGTRHPTHASTRYWEPQRGNYCRARASIHRVSEDGYVVCMDTYFPIRTEQVSQGVERFDFKDFAGETRVATIGTSEALIKANVVSASFFPDEFEDNDCKDWAQEDELAGWHTYTTRSLLRLSNGKWCYVENKKWIRKVEEARAKDRLWRAPSPEEWLEQREDMICAYARTILVQFRETDLEDLGVRYSADFQEIVNAIEVAAQRIRDVKVTVHPLGTKPSARVDASPDLRDASSAAASDKALQSFLKQTLDQAANAGRGGGRAPKS